MNRHNTIVISTALIFTLIVGLAFFSSGDNVTVALRCADGVTGKLTLSTELKKRKTGDVGRFDIKTICHAGKFTFGRYNKIDDIKIVLERSNDEKYEIVNRRGNGIDVDRKDGFYMLLTITNAPPYLDNFSI